MKLNNLDLIKLQSAGMRADPTVQALCEGLTPEFKDIAAGIQLLAILANIDAQPEEVLDELAWELDIKWYLKDAPIETKRKLVKNSDKVHQALGTPYAVEQVVEDYFGLGVIKEWFEYSGEPHHFIIQTTAYLTSETGFKRFVWLLGKVKRTSSWLEFLELLRDVPSFMGVAVGACRQHLRTIEAGNQIGG